MKKTITLLALTALININSAFGQGEVLFANGTEKILVGAGGPLAAGQMPTRGTQVFYFGLYVGATEPAQPTFLATNSGAVAGNFTGGNVQVGTAGIEYVIKGWSANLGRSYAEAQTALAGGATGYIGASERGSVTPRQDTVPLGTIPGIMGAGNLVSAFTLNYVPEPSAIALGVLGLGALILFRRRKN